MSSRPPSSGAGTFRAAYGDTLTNVGTLAAALDSTAWELPTGCPGWSVHDVIAHVCALESFLLGRPQPEHEIPEGLAHVRNPFGAFMEIGVDHRRPWPPDQVRAELDELIRLRLMALERLRDDQLDDEVDGFFGKLPQRNFLAVRIFDIWSHEQDIRRATGQPGGLEGPAGMHAREFMLRQLARSLQKAVEPPAGMVVRFDLVGQGGATRYVSFDGARGRVSDDGNGAGVALRMDLSTLAVLCCGRDDPGAPGRVTVEGDGGLAQRMLASFAFTP